VYRGRVAGLDIYVKHFHSRSPIHRVARALGASDARNEMRFAEYLASHGVATASALAAMCDDGVEWLATRAVQPAEPADRWHERQLAAGPAGRRAIQRGISALARLVGRMHAAGVIHRDLHCGNVLIRTDGKTPQPVLTDLHRAVRRPMLSRRAKAANLAQLFHDRYPFTTRTERLRFLKDYLGAGNGEGTLRGWQLLVEYFAARHTRRQNAQRDRRIFTTSRYFCPIELPRGWRGHVVLASKRRMGGSQAAEVEFAVEDWTKALADPDGLFRGEGVEVVKDSASSLVVHRKLTIGGHTLDVFIKRARRKRPWKALLDWCRRSRPIRAFKYGHMLLTRRIATALPLAALERRAAGFLVDSILITEAIEGQRLNDFLDTWLSRTPKGNEPLTAAQQHGLAQEVLWQLGRMVQRLHENRFAHRDLKSNNMLIHWEPGQAPEVVLVDLDGLRRQQVMTMRRRFQGLMRLNVALLKCPVVGHAGRLRMLLGYLRRPGMGRIDFKPFWRVLEEWSAKKLRRQIQWRRRQQKAVRRPAP
jgi:tRNA A-37 threonylcarbamoyl transferase component Bud32